MPATPVGTVVGIVIQLESAHKLSMKDLVQQGAEESQD